MSSTNGNGNGSMNGNGRPETPEPLMICAAKTKSGGICTNPPVKGRKRCRFHGGASPRGIKSASFKTGAHSQVREGMRQRAVELIDDPMLLDPRRGIATQLSAIEDLEQMESEADSPEFRRHLAEQSDVLWDMIQRREIDDFIRGFAGMRSTIKKGALRGNALIGLVSAAESLSRTQERFWKIAQGGAAALTFGELQYFMHALSRILEDEVGHESAQSALARADQECTGGAMGFAGS